MSDIRFIIIGILLIFSGFIVLSIFGEDYQTPSIETSEFENCLEFSEDKEPAPIDCSKKMFRQNILFGLVIALIAVGMLALVKGVRGDWDSQVKPEDMVGPSRDNHMDGNDSK